MWVRITRQQKLHAGGPKVPSFFSGFISGSESELITNVSSSVIVKEKQTPPQILS